MNIAIKFHLNNGMLFITTAFTPDGRFLRRLWDMEIAAYGIPEDAAAGLLDQLGAALAAALEEEGGYADE